MQYRPACLQSVLSAKTTTGRYFSALFEPTMPDAIAPATAIRFDIEPSWVSENSRESVKAITPITTIIPVREAGLMRRARTNAADGKTKSAIPAIAQNRWPFTDSDARCSPAKIQITLA